MWQCNFYSFCTFLLYTLVCCQMYFAQEIATPATDITQHPNWGLLDDTVCGLSTSADRIIGGTNASLGQFPWLALVGYTSRTYPARPVAYRCGASLINKNYVLTAAHCIPQNMDVYASHIRLGEHDTQSEIDCDGDVCALPVQDFKIAKVIVHENYGKPVYRNDIALIRLDRSAVYSDFVMPVCLPRGPLLTKNHVGTVAEVAGWGVYDMEMPLPSRLLLYVRVPVVDLHKCAVAFRSFTQVSEEQLCAGGVADKDSCAGDSGGPLVQVNAVEGMPRFYQLGLVSFGAKKCGKKDVPAVYTRVTSYLGWIMDRLEK